MRIPSSPLVPVALLSGVAVAGLSGCVPMPPPLPSPAGQLVASTAIERDAASCGAMPIDDESAEAATGSLLAAGGMQLVVDARIGAAAQHGEHEAGAIHAWVLDDAGAVAGFSVASSDAEGTPVPGGALWRIELGACEPAALAGPLPDGEYALLLTGSISPVDHVHDRAETWAMAPVAITVVDGEASPD